MENKKLIKIIEGRDSRVVPMVIGYIMDKGYTFCTKITDEEIEELEGNGIMSQEFMQYLVRTARDVCIADTKGGWDILAYIKDEMFIQGCRNN